MRTETGAPTAWSGVLPASRRLLPILLATTLLAPVSSGPGALTAEAARIRDIAQFRGIRENQLVGYGLVMGLDGSGDRKGTGFTMRSMSNLLESVGLTVSPDEMNVKNVAAVMVTATLPPFAKPGARPADKQRGERRVNRVFDRYLDWVEDSMTTEPVPFLQVIAVLRPEQGYGVIA